MKLRAFVCLLGVLVASLIFGTTVLAQVSPDEEQVLEEEFIRSRAENGESHASGNRDDLGPVILGNPTQAVVAIRVGIYYSFTATGAYSEFSSLNHPLVRISNTEGYAYVIDQSTGQQIDLISPGQIVEVSYTNAAGYSVTGPGGTFTVAGPVRFMPELPTN